MKSQQRISNGARNKRRVAAPPRLRAPASALLPEQHGGTLEIVALCDRFLLHGQKLLYELVLGQLLDRGLDVPCFRVEVLAVVSPVLLHNRGNAGEG